MKYTQLSARDIGEMLEKIGVSSIKDLFRDLPDSLSEDYPGINPTGMSETELWKQFRKWERNNDCTDNMSCFLGGGYYDHFIPAICEAIASRSEFYTAYTPYQAEASQGSLQMIWEFQTMMSELTGLPVSNASMYDGASGFAEAFLMALRLSRGKKKRFLYSATVNPVYIQVLKTYLQFKEEIKLVEIPAVNGVTDKKALAELIDENTAAVGLAYPNYFGQIEDLEEMVDIIKEHKAVPIASFYPIASSILKTPGELGFEIVTGNGQPLGNPAYYSGPTFGFFSTLDKYVRQLPGRLVSRTEDIEGKRGFVMTLQTREQHIKRERATSNICSNQTLNTLMAGVYMAFVGRDGFNDLGKRIAGLTAYALERFEMADIKVKYDKKRIFNEFVIDIPNPEKVLKNGLKKGIAAGIPLKEGLLVAITEKRNTGEIDDLVEYLKGEVNG